MNASDIPTPISDAARKPSPEYGLPDKVNFSVAQDLERKLTVARDTLAAINSSQVLEPALHGHIRNILEQTSPEPPCPKCGKLAKHYVGPHATEPGFYICQPLKETSP